MPELLPIKAIAERFSVSEWSLYEAIRTDPTFPVINLGPKKNYRIDPRQYGLWLREKSRRAQLKQTRIPTAAELLRSIKR
ncbi:MAG: hypothetical protein A2X94_13590 [Bdellovibrionales bacterium GWB1_55_8]|nr:MAG: hypothetical protein A2X94_13590 [Bdellovibrionales bacterium GWB1_55_8]